MKVLLLSLLLAAMPLSAAEMLLYQLIEPGVGASPSRVIVTERFMRMDDNIDGGDYVIFDRKKRTIYSVTHEDQTVFVIPPREDAIEPPMALKRDSEEVKGQPLPSIAGKPPRHYRLNVNDASCHNVIAIQGVMEDSVAALKAMRTVLAGEQRKALLHTPADMQDPCGLTMHAFHPQWSLEFGLPVQEWGADGRGQQLMDFDVGFEVGEGLFELPEGYGRYSSP